MNSLPLSAKAALELFGFFKSWRSIRWIVFIIALVIDGAIFYKTQPFTPLSFLASGAGALLLFLIFLEIALHVRGQGRIDSALDEKEKIVYQVGRHLFDLLQRIKKDAVASYTIWIPIFVAITTTTAIACLAWQIANEPNDPSWVRTFEYTFAGYLPLIIAVPFILEHVSEWTSWQYVLAVDAESQTPRLIVSHGVLDYNLGGISLERTVTTQVHQSFWQTLTAAGDVELHETAGGQAEILAAVWRPRRLTKQIQTAINRWRRGRGVQVD